MTADHEIEPPAVIAAVGHDPPLLVQPIHDSGFSFFHRLNHKGHKGHKDKPASERASEPRERSAPAPRRARERVGESEGQSPSGKNATIDASE